MRPDISGPECEPGSFSFEARPAQFDTVMSDELNLLENLNPAIQQARLVIIGDYNGDTSAEHVLSTYDDPVPKPTTIEKLRRIVDGMYMYRYAEMTAEDFKKKYLFNVYVEGSQINAESIEGNRNGRLRLYDATHTLATVLEHIGLQGSEDMYTSAKLLARDPITLTNETATQLLLQDYIYLAQETGHSKIYDNLEARVRSGALDEQIAKEKLNQLLMDDDIGVSDLSKIEALNMVTLHQKLTGITTEEVVNRLSQIEALDMWPRSAQEIIEISRKTLADALALRSREKRAVAYQGGFLLNASTEQDLEQFLLHNPLYRRKLNDNQLNLLSVYNPNKVAKLKAKPNKRQRLARKALAEAAAADDQENDSKLEIVTPQRKIYYVNSMGLHFSEDSPEFESILKSYCSSHEGQGLEDSLQNILGYIRNPPVVNGRAKLEGIKQVVGARVTVARVGRIPAKQQLFRMKPADVSSAHIKLSTPAKDIRIPFLRERQNDGTVEIYILGVMDRDDFILWLRSRGIKSSGEK